MISVEILEDNDKVEGTDWFRPLSFTGTDMGDSEILRFSCYSGRPHDHQEWVQVKDILATCWFNKTVTEINKGLRCRYEFMRGKLPKKMIWDWRSEAANANR